MEQTVWGHLPVLLRANSKESIEYILQALWRTRKTGLHSSDRCIIQDMLQLQSDTDLDPKFQREWQEDVLKDQNIVPRLKAMTWNMANQDKESTDPAAVINLKLQNDAQFHSGELDVKFQLATDSLEMMLKAMRNIRDQFSTVDEAPN